MASNWKWVYSPSIAINSASYVLSCNAKGNIYTRWLIKINIREFDLADIAKYLHKMDYVKWTKNLQN